MRLSFFLLPIALLFMWSCGNGDVAAEVAPAPTPQQPAATTPQLPSIPLEKIQAIYEQCDYIDYVFYYKNFSLNQSDKPAIQNAIRGISLEAPVLNPACKPEGRIFFQVDGRNAAEADIYLQQNCVYYVFMENNQPVYANKMTEEAVKFYINVFSMQQQPQTGQ